MNKPSLRDRRRIEKREALLRALDRREELIIRLVRNAAMIKKLKQSLATLEKPAAASSSIRVSLSEGRILDPLVFEDAGELNDEIPDLGRPA